MSEQENAIDLSEKTMALIGLRFLISKKQVV